MGVVVDTSALVAAERQGEPDTASHPEGWNRLLGHLAGEAAVLPAAVYAELLVGVQLADGPKRGAARRAMSRAGNQR